MSGKLERCLSAFAEKGTRHREYLDVKVSSPSCLKLVHEGESSIAGAVVDTDDLLHRTDQAFQAEGDEVGLVSRRDDRCDSWFQGLSVRGDLEPVPASAVPAEVEYRSNKVSSR